MTTEPYVPTPEDFVNLFAANTEGGYLDMSKRAKSARRGIAKIKADALRDAALMFSSRLGNSYSGVAVRGMLSARADRIEEEA